MAESYKVVVKVVSQKGFCDIGHKVGDEWIIEDYKTPKDICIAAYNTLYPDARVLIFGGIFPWGNDPDVSTIACPDAENPVIFELRRLRE
ncbi:TIGR04076 family protein [Chloroflexota bacterium]